MAHKYLEELYKKWKDGQELTRTEYEVTYSYNKMQEDECGVLVIDEISNLNGSEIYDIMSASDIEELYITGEWSNQFENWFNLQEAGFEMIGVREIDNPQYISDMKRYGSSWNKPKKYVLVFRICK